MFSTIKYNFSPIHLTFLSLIILSIFVSNSTKFQYRNWKWCWKRTRYLIVVVQMFICFYYVMRYMHVLWLFIKSNNVYIGGMLVKSQKEIKMKIIQKLCWIFKILKCDDENKLGLMHISSYKCLCYLKSIKKGYFDVQWMWIESNFYLIFLN